MQTLSGLLILAAALSLLLAKFARTPKRGRFPVWGWLGVLIVANAEALLFLGVDWVSVYFTPLVWTGYLLLIEAATRSLSGHAAAAWPARETLKLAFWSVPLWLLFEAYNLRLRNWTYVGLPEDLILQLVGYVWSFATIWPAIWMTAEFLRALGLFATPWRPRRFGRRTLGLLVVLGLLMVTLPVLVPAGIGQYLFGAVWVGFVLLLDPLNYWAHSDSLLGDLEAGRGTRLMSFLASGLLCGLLWEFWNYWATAKWLYIFPILQGWKIFEMPWPGYLGFPAFALECFVLYEFLGTCRRQLAPEGRRPARPAGFGNCGRE